MRYIFLMICFIHLTSHAAQNCPILKKYQLKTIMVNFKGKPENIKPATRLLISFSNNVHKDTYYAELDEKNDVIKVTLHNQDNARLFLKELLEYLAMAQKQIPQINQSLLEIKTFLSIIKNQKNQLDIYQNAILEKKEMYTNALEELLLIIIQASNPASRLCIC